MFQGAVLLAFMRDGVNFSTLRVVGSQERDLQARCCRIAALQSRESTATSSGCCSLSSHLDRFTTALRGPSKVWVLR